MFARLALGMAAVAGTLTPAFAQYDRVISSVSVSYSDLDLANSADRTRLEKRVKMAVRKVCATEPTQDLAGQMDEMRCRKEATAHARAKLDVALNRLSDQPETALR